MTREEYNKLILEELAIILKQFPDIRFKQLLYRFSLDDQAFYEESEDTYKKLSNQRKNVCM